MDKYIELYNPYDFSNPVTDRSLFVGRASDLNDIKYYLNQAKKAPRPMNIALLGPRAAGKTSFLNIIGIEAAELGFCVARIDLNEGDVSNALAFFFKLFDGIMSACVNFNKSDGNLPFGGKAGEIYQAYLEMVSMYEIPSAKAYCPFLFPIQYSKAMSRGIENCRVSDSNFKEDLSLIAQEVATPVLIMFDECNVLAGNRILLEMVRNIFMNLPGYMLVFTGTPELFPVMDEVFSPIVRQFKKITVDNFKDQEEVSECMKKPLVTIGITDTSSLFDPSAAYEVFDLTSGRAYEIQLLCHYMFRHLQEGRAKKMELSVEILDDVLRELYRGQNLSDRPIVASIKELDSRQLNALKLLCSCSGKATMDQLWYIEYMILENLKWKQNELIDMLLFLVKKQILAVEGDIISFAGDDFDRIYLKYYAKQRKVSITSFNYDLEVLLNLRVSALVAKHSKWKPFNRQYSSISKTYTATIISRSDTIFDILQAIDANNIDVCVLHRDMLRAILQILIQLIVDGIKEFKVGNVTVITNWQKTHHPFYTEMLDDHKLCEMSAVLNRRATLLGGSVVYTEKHITLASLETLLNLVVTINNTEITNDLLQFFSLKMYYSYLEEKDADKAATYGELAFKVSNELDASMYNDLGYIYLKKGDVRAEEYIREAISRYSDSRKRGLSYYNLGIVEGLKENKSEAAACFNSVIELIGEDEDKLTVCFLKLEKATEGYTLREVSGEKLTHAANEMLQLLSEER